ncbi:hypothetical protein EVAR_57935_1 [Eumeta japonica]|uniref:Uncharacterized protein n=1 Tax=Eumeta variegata TaxID=151549 RepID=A0A4C1ZQB2_EUMVA|nr:hypothetical protein EVAR_57935_1 [Eumeta japonica]
MTPTPTTDCPLLPRRQLSNPSLRRNHTEDENASSNFSAQGANFIQISADCTRLDQSLKAVRTADDGIKGHALMFEDFQESQQISWTNVSNFIPRHRRSVKVKCVIRSIPTFLKILRDLRALLALGDAVILFGDFNCKIPDGAVP